MIALNQLLVVGSLSLWEMVLGYWMYNLEVEDSL
jgi:hypothetical protein